MPRKKEIKIGETFGRWTVLQTDVYNPKSTSKTKIRCCLCQCSCENKTVKYVTVNRLINGLSQSCGCLRSEQLSKRNAAASSVKIGNKYGKLTVIKDLGMRKQNSRNKNERWSLCQCECGSEPIEVKNNLLQNGWKKSCGCLQSQGEYVIEKILCDNNIQYIKEYKFTNLLGINNGQLRFDFAIFMNEQLQFLIEFDGKQHYTGPEAGWTSGQSLETIQTHDRLKNDYCFKNHILLKRIPYTEIKNITIEKILNDDYNVVELKK